MIPRCIHRAYAYVAGYFWIPCPLCGREFGGHEWRSTMWEDGRQWSGRAICDRHGDCCATPQPLVFSDYRRGENGIVRSYVIVRRD